MPHSIAITGIGAQTPIGCSAPEILKNLRSQQSGIAYERLEDLLDLYFARIKGKAYEADADETLEFGRLALRGAMENGGANDTTWQPDRVATIIGCSKARLSNVLNGTFNSAGFRRFSSDTLGLDIAREHRFTGPTLNYPAACATGLTCLIPAIRMLEDEEIDAALVGSSEASGRALIMSGFNNMGALSPSVMKPFHKDRAGFNPGEGSAVVLLEREADARARGTEPVAYIRGWDYRSDAHHYTAADPTAEVVAYSIRRALARAGWQPSDIEYVNAHGTGTLLNDQVEARALKLVFGDNCPPVSSLKPYVGHLLAASSAVELALALLAAGDGYLPATLGLDFPDPTLSMNHVTRGGEHRRVQRFLKLSLGFGGQIAAVAIEMAGPRPSSVVER